jgi:CO/xanthine dehydrogenase Mo-binding subunit
MSELHEPAWRNDAYAKVTGKARYTDDLKFPGMLHAAPVYTPFVHARIESVNTARASAMEGVVRVLTAADVPGSNRNGQIRKDLRIFADDKIRFNGDVVALVVADTRDHAIAAAADVDVRCVPLPHVLDPEQALLPGAPLVHEDNGSNVINTHKVRRGDIDAGFAMSDVIIEHDFSTQFVEHAYMEPEAAVCVPRPDGVVEVFGSMQHPFSTRRFVASFLGVPLAQVEVTGVPMGGGFGGKDDTAAIVCARAALAAVLTGRPVKIMYRRDWSIRESYKRHPYRMHYRIGFTRDGRMRAVQCRIVADGGAYCSVTPWVTWRSTVQCCGPYVVDNVHCDTTGVYTNNVYTGAMRGFGSPQINFAVEQLIEIAAERLGIDAVELRRINMVRQGSVTITGQTLGPHVVSMEQVLDAVIKEIGYDEKLSRCSHGAQDCDDLYGIGLAMSYRGVSLGAEGTDFCAAIVNVQADGSILLETGMHENGMGVESAAIILLAQELGVPCSRIRYRRASSSVIPDSGTTVASRGTIMGGGATVEAARLLKQKMSATAAVLLRCDAGEVSFSGECLHGGGRSVTFNDVISAMFQTQQFPYAMGVYRAPRVSWDEETGQGNAYFTWVYGCQAVELTVNRHTGKLHILNMVAAHDVGRAVNPAMLLGQIYGGIAMSTGYALFEEVRMKDGCVSSLNFNTYRLPRSIDLPDIKAIIIQNPDPISPSGAKSIGEPANEIMAPAIANAMYRATGIRHFSLPMHTPPGLLNTAGSAI